MSRRHDPLEVARELRFSLVDRPDPPLNYIEALDRLIATAEVTPRTPEIERLLRPFEDKYSPTIN